eukprot:6463352-Amphidinium_carterae.1
MLVEGFAKHEGCHGMMQNMHAVLKGVQDMKTVLMDPPQRPCMFANGCEQFTSKLHRLFGSKLKSLS